MSTKTILKLTKNVQIICKLGFSSFSWRNQMNVHKKLLTVIKKVQVTWKFLFQAEICTDFTSFRKQNEMNVHKNSLIICKKKIVQETWLYHIFKNKRYECSQKTVQCKDDFKRLC